MAHPPAPRTAGGATLIRVGGTAGLAGGLAWVVKGSVILALDRQPPLTFELALPLLGLNLVGVVLLTAHGTRRSVGLGLSWLSVLAGVVALAGELLHQEWHVPIAASAAALLAGQLTLRTTDRTPAALVLWVGVGTLPALAVGGALAEIDEQLLEIPLACVGLAWMLIGWTTLRTRDAAPASP